MPLSPAQLAQVQDIETRLVERVQELQRLGMFGEQLNNTIVAQFGNDIASMSESLGADAPEWMGTFNIARERFVREEAAQTTGGTGAGGGTTSGSTTTVNPELKDLESRVDQAVQALRNQGNTDDQIGPIISRQFGDEINNMAQSLGADAPEWMNTFIQTGQELGFIGEDGVFDGDAIPDNFPDLNPAAPNTTVKGAQGDLVNQLASEINRGGPQAQAAAETLGKLGLNLPGLTDSQLLGSENLRNIPEQTLLERGGDPEALTALLGGNPLANAAQSQFKDLLAGQGVGSLQGLIGQGAQGATALQNQNISNLQNLQGLGALPGQDLTAQAGQVGANLGGVGADTPLNQFINQSLGQNLNTRPEFVDAFKRQIFDPQREALLGDLANRGILNSSERIDEERRLLGQAFTDPLLLQERQARENAAQLGIGAQSTGLQWLLGAGGQAAGIEAERRAQQGQLLGQGLGLQQQLAGQATGTAGALGGLLGQGAQTGQQNLASQLAGQELGLRQTQTAADIAAGNRQAAQGLLGTQAGILGDTRDFAQGQQDFSRLALSDLIGQELARQAGIDFQNRQLAEQRRSSNLGLITGASGTIAAVTAIL